MFSYRAIQGSNSSFCIVTTKIQWINYLTYIGTWGRIWTHDIFTKNNRMHQLSFNVVGLFFFLFCLIIIILEKATFIILISFHFLNIPRNQTEHKRFYIGNFNEQHYKTQILRIEERILRNSTWRLKLQLLDEAEWRRWFQTWFSLCGAESERAGCSFLNRSLRLSPPPGSGPPFLRFAPQIGRSEGSPLMNQTKLTCVEWSKI